MTTTNESGTVITDHVIGRHGRLAIRLAAAELRLAGTDGDRVIVRTPGGASLPERVIVETVDGGLTIREKELRGLTFSLGRKVVQLEIEVPATAEIAIDTASGWLDGQGLRGEQRYRTASGETRLLAGAGRIEFNTVSGDVAIELADTADLAVKSVSGDLQVRGASLSGLRIGTTSGDVRIDSPLVGRTGNAIETLSGDVTIVATSGLRVEARTVSGDLTSALPHRSEGQMGRRTLIVGDGGIELGFRSVSGDLRIHDGSGRDAAGAFESPAGPDRPGALRGPEMPGRPPMPAAPPMPPLPASPSSSSVTATTNAEPALDDPQEMERMAILRALEQGEFDVPTAMDRLAALDGDDDGQADGRAAPDPKPRPTDG